MANLKGLVPGLRDLAQELLDMGREEDPRLVVTSGVRTFAEQQRLYARFQAGESSLPAAKPGTSKHELGLAFDIARPNVDPHDDELLEALGEAWEEAGGVWGGRFGDPVHFEAPKGFQPDEDVPAGHASILASEEVRTGLALGARTALESVPAYHWAKAAAVYALEGPSGVLERAEDVGSALLERFFGK